MRTDTHTPFHIDVAWWTARGRNLRRFLAEIVGDPAGDGGSTVTDYIDADTAEVYRLDSLWAKVLSERAFRPDYITSATPMTNAVFRALIENLNQPMTPIEFHRRINRGSPDAILRVLRTARTSYGIVPVHESAATNKS